MQILPMTLGNMRENGVRARRLGRGCNHYFVLDVMGWTIGTLRVKCLQLKISLKRPAKLFLPPAILDHLTPRGESIGVSTVTPAADLLKQIARDKLFDAVLDRDDTEVTYAAAHAAHF